MALDYRGNTVYRGTIPIKLWLRFVAIAVLTAVGVALWPLGSVLWFAGAAVMVSLMVGSNGGRGSIRSPELRPIAWKPQVLYWRQRPFWAPKGATFPIVAGAFVWLLLTAMLAWESAFRTDGSLRSFFAQWLAMLAISAIVAQLVDLLVLYWFLGKTLFRMGVAVCAAMLCIPYLLVWQRLLPELSLGAQVATSLVFLIGVLWSTDLLVLGVRRLFARFSVDTAPVGDASSVATQDVQEAKSRHQ